MDIANRRFHLYCEGVNRFIVGGLVALLLIAGATVGAVSANRTAEPTAIATYRARAGVDPPDVAIVEAAARVVFEQQGSNAMIAFLTTHVQRFPDDANNGYYLTIVGEAYEESGAVAMARMYYRRALLGAPDALVANVSTHRVAVNRLLSITTDPVERLEYLTFLRDNTRDAVDPGLLAYYLGEAYEGVGEWDAAYASYREFLRYPQTRIPGRPDAHDVVGRRVAFYDSPRQWTHPDLDQLVLRIKGALWSQNPQALLRYRAGENFFSMSWTQDQSDANSAIPTFDIAAFLRRSRVRYAEELDISSNATEAYLRTWGWSHRIPTWYLYFRRVDFPADPEIDGNWEWAGIFFGEPL